MAIPTVDPGTEVKSIHHNSIVGLLNGTADDATNTYAQPVKLYQFNNASTPSLIVGNQDTSNGLIAQFQYGPVGAATTVVRITKAGLIGSIYRDSGPVFELEAFAAVGTAIRGASPSEDPDAAWLAAFAAVAAAGGGTILLGPYTYLGYSSTSNWQSNCIIRGAGMYATSIKRRAGSSTPAIYFLGKSNSGIVDLGIDDNYTNNTTAPNCAASIDGPGCFAYRVYIHDFNLDGIGCTGIGTTVMDCLVAGIAPGSYTSNGGDGDNHSRYGIACGSVLGHPCARIKILGNTITGIRSAAISVGGPGAIVANNTINDCHRGDFPAGTPGGNIALSITTTTVANDTPPSQSVIVGNTITGGGALIGGVGGSTGIEIDSAAEIIVANNAIFNTTNGGISVNASGGNTADILIAGNTIASVNTAAGAPGAGGSVGLVLNGSNGAYTTSAVVVRDNFINTCTNAIWTENHVQSYSFFGNVLTGNTTGWTKDDSAADWQSWGNALISGAHAPLPNKVYQSNATAFPDGSLAYIADLQQASATGHGLHVNMAGATASQIGLLVANSAVLLGVFADGQVTIGGPVNGQTVTFKTLTELKPLAVAGFSDTTIQMPAAALIVSVDVRVTTAISGGGVTSFSVGDSGSATRFSTTGTVALTLGTTDKGTKAGLYYNASALSIRLTMNGGSPTGGVVRVTIRYLDVTAATS